MNGILSKGGGGSGKQINSSTLGKLWEKSNTPSLYFDTIEYGNGIWVAGYSESYQFDPTKNASGIWYSRDGKNWSQSNITNGSLFKLYYNNGIWGAVDSVNNKAYYSSNGINWQNINIPSSRSMITANNIWLIAADHIYYSTDGINYSLTNISNGYVWIDDLCYANGTYVLCLYNTAPCGFYSKDGKNWSTIKTGVINNDKDVGAWNLDSLILANDAFFGTINVTTCSGLFRSTDGINWNKVSDDVIFVKKYANGTFIGQGMDISNEQKVYHSKDGIHWTASETSIKAGISAIEYAEDTWVIGFNGYNMRFSIDDGKTWNQVFPPEMDSNWLFGGIIYCGDGLWVAGVCGNHYLVYSVLKGHVWEYSSLIKLRPSKIVYENGMLVVATTKGIYYSE